MLREQSSRFNPNHSFSSDTSLEIEDSLVFCGDAVLIPKNKNTPSEDAYFITEKGVGVSDGVGGWNAYGINSSLFSNNLMLECQRFIGRVLYRQQQSLVDPRITLSEFECHRQALESKQLILI